MSKASLSASSQGGSTGAKVRSKSLGQRAMDNWQMYALLLIPVVLTVVYKYIPMYGIQIAFRDFSPNKGFMGSTWVGLRWFERFFSAPTCSRMIRNTVLISLYSLLWSFPIPIILSLIINQLRFQRYKRVVQTVLYAPHFISIMIVCGMIRIFLSPSGGLLNLILGSQTDFLTESSAFRTIYIASGIWQDAGWGCIIYLATLANVDPGLYEAAKMDGASVFQRILHIDIPELVPMAVLNLIMAAGGLMNVGFEKVWLLQTDRLNDIVNFWLKYVPDMAVYPGDCIFTSDELETLDQYKADFETQVAEQEALWLKNGGPSDAEWDAYLQFLNDSCGMGKILEVYQNAYNRYAAVK